MLQGISDIIADRKCIYTQLAEDAQFKTQAVHTTVRSDLGTAYIWRVASSDPYAKENRLGK